MAISLKAIVSKLNDTTRKTLLTAAIITSAVGSFAFAMNAELNLTKRSTQHQSAAEDEEGDHAESNAGDKGWRARGEEIRKDREDGSQREEEDRRAHG